MKIIDQTPFINEKGEISLMDRAKATLKFGPSWYGEVQAQTSILNFLERGLDKGVVLLRNFTLPGTQATIPMILVGVTGIYVLYATNLSGMYRARGDEWGVIENKSVKQSPVNLLVRTARMARAVQVFLERQGYILSTAVEGILVGANPSLHVESVRPIVRVVLRDALERFITSISQARPVMTGERVMDVVNHIQHPRQAKKAVEEPTPKEEPAFPTYQFDETPPAEPSQMGSLADNLGFAFEDTPQSHEPPLQPVPESPLASTLPPATEGTSPEPASGMAVASPPASTRFNRKQWGLLIAFGVIEVIILVVFGILVISDFM